MFRHKAMEQIAVFDFDGTVIRGDSVVALLLFARKRKLISSLGLLKAAWYGALYHLRLTDALTAKQKSHSFLMKIPEAARESFLREFAGTLADRAFPGALEQIKKHRAAGDTVILCSASCSCYMRYVLPLIGAEHLLCTPCGPDGRVLGPNCRGQEKVRRVYEWLDARKIPHSAICAAYGDSMGDAHILLASAQPVLVNPKRSLRRALPKARLTYWQE